MKKILVVNNYDSFVFNIVQLLREIPSAPDFEVMYNDRIVWERLNEFGGIILSPGPGIPAQAGDLLRLIECCKHSHPLLGICLGHQALAEVFGASLSNLSGPLHGHSSVLKLLDCKEPLFSGLTEPLVVGRYHFWVVDRATIPADLLVSSVDEQGHVMSFHHLTLPVFGLQFHPESYISNCGKRIVENWLDLCQPKNL